MRASPVFVGVAVLVAFAGGAQARAPEALGALRPEAAHDDVGFTDSEAPVTAFFPRADRARARLRWNWPRFSTSEYVATSVAASVAVAAAVLRPTNSAWSRGVFWDEDARSSLRLGSYQDRRAARDVSDVLLALTVSYPILVDGVLAASWYYESPEVAEQLVLISTETLAITAAVHGIVSTSVGRERPFGRSCGSELSEESRDCDGSARHRSFFSGHASLAFAGASLVCINRAYLPLHGGGAADAVTCGSAYVAAASTATLRVVSDMHYTTDVLAGAAWGTLAGLTLPWLLHYRHGTQRPKVGTYLVPYPGGVAFGGHF